jgi:hypothetical protein
MAEFLLEAVDERLAGPAPHDETRVLHHARAQLVPRKIRRVPATCHGAS